MSECLWNLFLSHSTGKAPGGEAARLLDRLLREFGSPTFDLLVDRRIIAPSDDWKRRIDEGLSRANAAIALVDRQALLDSRWAEYEIAVLRHLQGARGLRLYAVLIGITRKDLEASDAVGPDGLRDVHVITYHDEEQTMAELHEQLPRLSDDITDAEVRLVRELARCLPDDHGGAVAVVDALERAAPRTSPLNVREFIAHRMRKLGMTRAVLDVVLAHKVFFLGCLPDLREHFVLRLESSWIDARVASAHLPRRADSHTTRVLAACARDASAVQYVREATGWVEPCAVEPFGDVPTDPEGLDEEVDRSLEVWGWKPGDLAPKGTLYVVVRAARPSRTRLAAVEAWHRARPDVIAVLVVDDTVDPVAEKFETALGGDYHQLPPLTTADEHRASFLAGRLREALGLRAAS
ncbi:TIR domain-containing protein [Actinosynnema sp. NPDC050436]|uniref:TIR domain-containing protein n=1 Tax=Actinosynnema sp. NPDC050436 TaxID=3155659 RepID=UPI0033CB3150